MSDLCENCDQAFVDCRLPDGSGICRSCYRERRRETAGCPDCPACGHRFWVSRLGNWGYRCDCGLKFRLPVEAPAAAVEERPVLFAPARPADIRWRRSA